MKIKNRKRLRIVIITLVSLLVLAGGISIWFSVHYKGILKQRVPGWVAKATDSAYHISFRDISINLLTRNVTIEGLRIWPDTAQIQKLRLQGHGTTTMFDVAVAEIQIKGVKLSELLAEKELSCSRLIITRPKAVITTTPELADSLRQKPPDSLLINKQKKTPAIERIYASQIQVIEPNVTYQHVGEKDTFLCYLNKGSIVLNEWEFNPIHPKDGDRFFYAKSGKLNINEFIYKVPGSMYGVRSSNIDFTSDQNSMEIKKLHIGPVVGHEAFYEQLGHQADIYTLDLPSVKFTGFNWQKLLNGKQLFATGIALDKPSIEIYFSKIPSPIHTLKYGKFPGQLLLHAKMPISIKDIALKGGHVKYTEVSRATKMAGSLSFDAINGHITNVTNIKEEISRKSECVAKLRTKVLGTSELNATFVFSLADTSGAFDIQGTLFDLTASQVNPLAIALGQAEVVSLQLNKMDMRLAGNEQHIAGNFTVLYNNFKVKLKKVDDVNMGRGKQLRNKTFTSFMANKVFLYTDNPMGGDPVRSVSNNIKNDGYKSFFNLIWSCIFDGAQRTGARNEAIADMLQQTEKAAADKAKAKGAEQKKGIIKRVLSKIKGKL